MDTTFWVIRVILFACFMTLVITAVAFAFSGNIISWVAVDMKPEKFTYFVVAALGGATAIGLQLHGRLFDEKSHLYEQWAKGVELLSSEEEPKVLRGIQTLADLGSRAKWSYKYRVIEVLVDRLRQGGGCKPTVQTSVIDTVSSLLVVRYRLLWEFFGNLNPKRGRKIIDLGGIEFMVPVRMTGLGFSRRVCFDGSSFLEEFNLSGSIFLKEVSFNGCLFCGDVTFSRSRFAGKLILSDGSFEKDVNFCESLFKEEFLSLGHDFHGVADFSDSHFYRGVKFFPKTTGHGGGFQGVARFQRVNFYRDVCFGEFAVVGPSQAGSLIFESSAHFEGACFHGDAIFRGAAFCEGVRFGAQRKRMDSREESLPARFLGTADFSGADFSCPASHARRKRNVTSFSGVIFHRRALFYEVKNLSLDELLKGAEFLDPLSPVWEQEGDVL